MQLLRNFDVAKEYYDLKTRKVAHFDAPPNMIGWYKIINNDLSGIFVQQGKLLVIWKGVNFDTENGNILLTAAGENGNRVLTFNMGNKTLFSFAYKLDISYADTPPFDYLDEDDSDWGAYLAGIINDDARRKQFIDNLTGGE